VLKLSYCFAVPCYLVAVTFAAPVFAQSAGWVYSRPQEHTLHLYLCYNAREQSHFASNQADCEGLGAMERLLGFAMSQ
jgi:hypothetical protein